MLLLSNRDLEMLGGVEKGLLGSDLGCNLMHIFLGTDMHRIRVLISFATGCGGSSPLGFPQ